MATISSCGFAKASLKALLPILPKPLIATFIIVFSINCYVYIIPV